MQRLSNYIDQLSEIYRFFDVFISHHPDSFRELTVEARRKIFSICYEGVQSFSVTNLMLSYDIITFIVTYIAEDVNMIASNSKKVAEWNVDHHSLLSMILRTC